ncbi:MOSC domain-containing protein [Paludisphaera mucosa]|uniref:MOSC domain-containing protein n=1 Tax=Paludisphaera mucosa TaxID=3030827 RepID=A0ABT6FE93_9BACT|nr:MOSC domain-containing protein [Paludisphaera mucosa]MDG3005698.1 hypothetical protein [Paludisphaera mucosa]
MGRIELILTSRACGTPMESHEAVELLPGLGIAGDRYATGRGFYSGVAEWDAHVTLIRREPFDAVAAEHGAILDPVDLRRNLVTAGVDLHSLVGRRFRVGDRAILLARKVWPPCQHIVRSSGRPEIYRLLGRACGIGASVIEGGVVRLGDLLTPED